MSLLTTILAFLVTIGILVTIHEFGHYWVARRLGVKVLRFSIGFGKPLWKRVSKDADRVEYVLAALPLGGYVKMLDERECEADDKIPEHELARAFNRQVLWKRAAIVFAGPLANFLLAIVIYALTFIMGVDTFRPVVEVRKDTPASIAGFQTGDTLTAINGEAVASWDDLHMLLVEDYLKSPRLEVSVITPEGNSALRVLDLGDKPMFKDESDFLNKVGLSLWTRGIGISGVLAGSAAEQAGLQAGDKVLSINGISPQSIHEFIQIVQNNPGQVLSLRVLRNENEMNITVTPQSKVLEGKTVGALGANVGAYMTDAARAELAFTQRYGVFEALWRGVVKTQQMAIVTLKLMGRMLTGEVALKNVSGPVTIAQFAGASASIGLGAFLGFLAIVSISLGVLNLLPVPMLDGGHLMYYLIELVKGSPVSAEVEAVGLRIGIALIGCLMVLALYNDFIRLMN